MTAAISTDPRLPERHAASDPSPRAGRDARAVRARPVALALGLLAAAFVLLAPELPSTHVNGDAASYVGSARSLLDEGRLVVPFSTYEAGEPRMPMAHYPPGYPLALAVPLAAGASADQAVTLVRALSAFVAIGLLTLVVAGLAGELAGAAAGLLALATPTVVFVFQSALSEAFFLALVATAVWLMLRRPERALAYGVAVAAVVMVRYIGIAFTGTAVLWALAQRGGWRRRLARGVAAGAPTLVALLAWSWWAEHEEARVRRFGVQAPVGDTLRKLAGAVSRWLVPGAPDSTLTLLAKVAALAAFAAVLVVAARVLWTRWRQLGDERDERALGFLGIVAVSSLLYWAAYALARVFADHALDFHPRYWAPLELLYAGALIVALAVVLRHGGRALRVVGAASVALWGVATLVAGVSAVRYSYRESRQWRERFGGSPMLAWVRALPADRAIFTNWSGALYRYTGRSSRELPIVDDPRALSLLDRRLRETNGIVVSFPDRNPIPMVPLAQRSRYLHADAIAARLGLELVARFPDGAVYRPAGASPDADETAPRR